MLFNISKNLYDIWFNDDRYISSIMPMNVKNVSDDFSDEKLMITGSVVFEDQESGEVTLTIIRSDDENKRQYYP